MFRNVPKSFSWYVCMMPQHVIYDSHHNQYISFILKIKILISWLKYKKVCVMFVVICSLKCGNAEMNLFADVKDFQLICRLYTYKFADSLA